MRFDTKIGIVVREDLATWQKPNVTAFLASGIAGGAPGVMGEPYADASGNTYLPLFRQPVLVYAATATALAAAHARAVVRAHPAESLPLVGIAVHGPRNSVDKTLKGLPLHP